MKTEPKYFCKAPFKSTVIDTGGLLLPCCEFMTGVSDLENYKLNAGQDWHFNKWWTQGLDPLREKMLRGEVDKGCEHCIVKEKHGLQNHRQVTNSSSDDSYEKIKQDYLAGKRDYPEQVELRLGNYCNLKCIMCGPYASSSIMNEYKKNQRLYNDFGIESNWQDPHMTKNWYSYDHNKDLMLDIVSKATRLNFGGGEPFISPVIGEVLDAVSPQAEISFNTNMTKINDKILDALKKFKKVSISASIDGVGSYNDYLRHGSDWSGIEKNFQKILQLDNVNLYINYVLQHTSIYTLPGVIDFAKKNRILLTYQEVYHGSVDGSGHLTLNSACKQDVDSCKDWIDSTEFTNKSTVKKWCDSYAFDKVLHERFKKYVKLLDDIRGNSFIKTFNPSWA